MLIPKIRVFTVRAAIIEAFDDLRARDDGVLKAYVTGSAGSFFLRGEDEVLASGGAVA
ncbi:hypothetical protein ASPCADRAFT_204460 [Aspergillus carbonarius ITEM 5010]|uniref:Uncharacterized protein n=1 Tax=Aspergillus carbonarius (strain ITEM 5010) TaxID=602072 RepID=A0A1R3RW21_ASPC5|nr:hypothetical protein ASPCADRAFT_204460 [Aspergillus carbonarius ITEM 5010]